METFAISLCHNDPEVIKESIEQFYKTTSGNIRHGLLDAHWPINKEGTRAVMEELREKYGCEIYDAGKNIGLHSGFNFVFEQMKVPRDSLIIMYDPDSFPISQGWDWAMLDIIKADPTMAWLGLWHPHCEVELKQEKRAVYENIAGFNVWTAHTPCMISVNAFNSNFLHDVGGLSEPCPLYGGLEVEMFPKLTDLGYRQGFLEDYKEIGNHFKINPHYTDWKRQTTHGGEEQIPFPEWLKKHGIR